jgi:hypothetical protein
MNININNINEIDCECDFFSIGKQRSINVFPRPREHVSCFSAFHKKCSVKNENSINKHFSVAFGWKTNKRINDVMMNFR